jgi:hypothetical protein
MDIDSWVRRHSCEACQCGREGERPASAAQFIAYRLIADWLISNPYHFPAAWPQQHLARDSPASRARGERSNAPRPCHAPIAHEGMSRAFTLAHDLGKLAYELLSRGEEAICGVDAAQQSPTYTSSPRDHELEYLRRKVDELQKSARIETAAHNVPTPPIPGDVAAVPRPADNEDDAIDGGHDSVAQDAASILEFLAWGRKKDPNLPAVVSPEVDRNDRHDCNDSEPDPFDDCTSLSVLQLLLPDAFQVHQLVDYHCDALLWYHGSFYAPAFRAQLEVFWSRLGGQLTSPGINLQWVALLFSIMAGSLTCAPPAQAQSWGYRSAEQATLSKRWFEAITACLNRANYTSDLSIFSCQAIATGTISAHLLGFSSSQSIQLAAAVRIAQSLGLHRLSATTSGTSTEKEIGRRVWTQLCSQDWFGIPFSESYLVNPLYSTSEPPSNCHDRNLVPLPSSVPTITSYCRFLYDIAAIMPQLQDGLMSCNTAYTRYEQVLKWDARLRNLAIKERPPFLSTIPIDASWPAWITWGRRALAISSSHKIIMIHRSFLSDSFTNSAFAFTRRTCLAASKTIIKEYRAVVEEDGPILWIHQAFAVAAGIILSLDILHRDQHSQEYTEELELVDTVVAILHSCRNSTIATRGTKLLEALLTEISKRPQAPHGTKRTRDGTAVKHFDVPAFVKTLQEHESVQRHDLAPPALQESSSMYASAEPGQCATNDFSHLNFNFSFAPQGLHDANGFENLLYLANHDISGPWI